MVDYREILRLQSLGYNITQIAGSLRSSRNTVREVERLADEKGIRWPLGEKVTNPQLYVLLYPERQEKANVYLEPDCAWIHRELAKKGVNLTLLWKEYQANCSNAGRVPYQYTQFCDIYRAWAKKSKATASCTGHLHSACRCLKSVLTGQLIHDPQAVLQFLFRLGIHVSP